MSAAIRTAALIGLLLASPVVHAQRHAAPAADPDKVTRWQPYIDEASLRFGIPASWIVRVMRAESAGRTTQAGRPIRSRVGAMGLMQLMPATWAEMRTTLAEMRLGTGSDPDEPRANILAGTLYLRLMYDRFGYPGLFGAYNAGPARYAEYLAGRHPLPGETTAYLAQLAGRSPGSSATAPTPPGVPAVVTPAAAPPPALFAVRRDAPKEAAPEAAQSAATLREASLFAIRNPAP